MKFTISSTDKIYKYQSPWITYKGKHARAHTNTLGYIENNEIAVFMHMSFLHWYRVECGDNSS